MRQTTLLLTLGIIASLLACRDPQSIDEDRDTMTCLINGRRWEAQVKTFSSGVPVNARVWYSEDGLRVSIFGTQEVGEDDQDLSIDLMEIPPSLTTLDPNEQKSEIFYGRNDGPWYWLDTASAARVTLDLIDTVANRLKGSFEFDVLNKHGDRLEIREGYFDVEIDNR
jgi:hypothetical protein